MRKFVFGVLVGILGLPAGVLLLAWLGLFSALANVTPPVWEKAFAQMTLNAYVSRHAPHLLNPVPATDENLLAGMKIYKDACAGCHGDPNATSDYGASFYPQVPQFVLNPPRKPDWQLFWIVRNGVRYSGMSAWDRQWQNDKAVSDDHIWKVVTFLSRLDSLPPTVNAEWHRKPQP